MATLTVKDVRAKIETHEAVCAQRMSELLSRVKRLETIILGSAGAIIILLCSLLFK
tara:strand:+ start:262 stop:429 length:168 start_codon:yes stop_codon:yes gene_type:complete